jgi:hypothetical protein
LCIEGGNKSCGEKSPMAISENKAAARRLLSPFSPHDLSSRDTPHKCYAI